MKITAHTKYGVFEGVSAPYNEDDWEKLTNLIKESKNLSYFCMVTNTGEIYFTPEMIEDTLFVLEK
ncbi:hypothetical protein b3_0174 [Synechococcus phage B3]|nr:hypothetical protein b3_0174 [Synechococcus phage B3]QGT54788.1 hypothetical protein b23_0173 [Synechococcus phage B23]